MEAISFNNSLVRFTSNQELDEREAARKQAEQTQNEPVVSGLAAHARRRWEAARSAKEQHIQRVMLDALRQRRGEYSDEKLEKIRKQGGSEIFMMLTSVKCRAAESWINDIMNPPGDKPWGLRPTPIPDLPEDVEYMAAQQVEMEARQLEALNMFISPEMMQERMEELGEKMRELVEESAKDTAMRMEERIHDQFVEGGWDEAFRACVGDIVTFPAAIMKGPIIRRRPTLKWGTDEQGNILPVPGEELRREYVRVSPLDAYPAPYATDIDNGYFIERMRLTPVALQAMKGVPGYDSGAIDLVLEQYGRGGLRQWLWNDQERAKLEDRENDWLSESDTIDAICLWDQVLGRTLIESGMSPDDIPDPNRVYDIELWLVGRYVICLKLNSDPLGRKPYSKACFEEIPGSFWGRGLPQIISDIQDVCNATARALVNNMAISSGPQVEVHTDRMADGERITEMFPWKIWQTNSDPMGGGHPAVNFYQPNINAAPLLEVFERFSKYADDYSGIPAYAYGSANVSGAGRTASGLSMLMSAASKGIKQVVGNLDKLVKSTVERAYYHNMLYEPDNSIKGDLKVEARGSTALIAKEQLAMRRIEFMQATTNQFDMQIMGLEGRAELLRENAKSLDMQTDKVVPSRSQMAVEQAKALAAQNIAAMEQQQQQSKPEEADLAGNKAGGSDMSLF